MKTGKEAGIKYTWSYKTGKKIINNVTV